jgi:hypothetical protein
MCSGYSLCVAREESVTELVDSTEKVHVIRERSFFINGDREGAVFKALAQLRREGVTGQLILDMNCGGVATIRFQEKHPVGTR